MIHFEKYELKFRTVDVDDAEFILSLRNDPKLNKHLSPTSSSVQSQRDWITSYKSREKQGLEYYFVVLDEKNERIGLNRIYKIIGEQFEVGSWLYKPQESISIPVLGDITIRDYAFETLGLKKCTFEVRKDNKQVLKYHKMFKPTVVGEDEDNFYFELGYDDYLKARQFLLNTFKK